jgi:hypothetical protein
MTVKLSLFFAPPRASVQRKNAQGGVVYIPTTREITTLFLFRQQNQGLKIVTKTPEAEALRLKNLGG